MSHETTPFFFACEGASLIGLLTQPDSPARIGVVVVVGGPQYRVGSHRQFVLLARALAEAGIACLRFDYRGMGDSDGPRVSFEAVHADIAAAIAELTRRVRSIEHVVLWGLCDGASASAFFAGADPRVRGLVLFNPWVRTESGEARTMLRHYYVRRVTDPQLWRKLFAGELRIGESLRSFARQLLRARTGASPVSASHDDRPLPERVIGSMAKHRGPVLVALSGNDAVAAEYRSVANGPLGGMLQRVDITEVPLPDADHTLSRREWHDAGVAHTVAWLRERFA